MLWEALSSKQLQQAAADCQGVCILPLGVIEKHGDHLPLGTDMYIGRAVAERAAEVEKAVVFPYYFLGQIMEGAHYPGTIACQGNTILQMLEVLCDEIYRNGFQKILIVSSHGGNTSFLNFFVLSLLGMNKPYMVYATSVLAFREGQTEALLQQFGEIDMEQGRHAGLKETALMLTIAPELVDIEAQDPAYSASLKRNQKLKQNDVITGFDWYSQYPYHYAGNHLGATPELGQEILALNVMNLAEAIKAVKEDKVMTELAKEFLKKSQR